MRLLVILALASGCGRKTAPTTEWCSTYVRELRQHATHEIDSMTQDGSLRRRGAEELVAQLGFSPANDVVTKVCSDANEDSPDHAEWRTLRINDLRAKIVDYVLIHSDAGLDKAQATELAQLVEQFASTYTDPDPKRP